jgi:hypothetical protein
MILRENVIVKFNHISSFFFCLIVHKAWLVQTIYDRKSDTFCVTIVFGGSPFSITAYSCLILSFTICYCGNGTSVAGCTSEWKSLYVYPLGNHMQYSFARMLASYRSLTETFGNILVSTTCIVLGCSALFTFLFWELEG